MKLCPQITAFVSLKRFAVASNGISELPPMGSFRNMTYLNVANNKCVLISSLYSLKLTYMSEKRITNLPNDILQTPIAHLNIGGNGMSKVPELVCIKRRRRRRKPFILMIIS